MNKKLLTTALALTMLITMAICLSSSQAAANRSSNVATVDHPDYIQLVPLFEDDEENNIRQLPANTLWQWDNGKYRPVCCPAGYESAADYPDCYWQYPSNEHYPPDNPLKFLAVQTD